MILMTIVGIASSFTFVLTAVASGLNPTDIIALANASRTKAGLATLSENATLATAAKNKANDMIKNDYFAHTSPKGVEPWYWIKDAGYQYKAAGENLAINYTDATEQHEAWMKSETHRANILNARYQEIGVAVVHGKIAGKESTVTVEYFGSPLVAAADTLAPTPAPVVPAPAIKGVEAVAPTVAPLELAKQVSVPPVPVVLPAYDRELLWLIVLSLAWFALTAVFVPLAFLAQALRVVRTKEGESETVSIPVVTPIHIDGVHKNAH